MCKTETISRRNVMKASPVILIAESAEAAPESHIEALNRIWQKESDRPFVTNHKLITKCDLLHDLEMQIIKAHRITSKRACVSRCYSLSPS